MSSARATNERLNRERKQKWIVGFSNVVLRNEHVFDHGLVDAMGVPKVLPEALGIFVEPVASLTLGHFTAAGKMNEMIVTFSTSVCSKGFATCQTFAGTIGKLDHFVERN